MCLKISSTYEPAIVLMNFPQGILDKWICSFWMNVRYCIPYLMWDRIQQIRKCDMKRPLKKHLFKWENFWRFSISSYRPKASVWNIPAYKIILFAHPKKIVQVYCSEVVELICDHGLLERHSIRTYVLTQNIPDYRV